MPAVDDINYDMVTKQKLPRDSGYVSTLLDHLPNFKKASHWTRNCHVLAIVSVGPPFTSSNRCSVLETLIRARARGERKLGNSNQRVLVTAVMK